MKNIKKQYTAPIAEITEFECEDIITTSKTLKTGIGKKQFVRIESPAKWGDIFNSGE